MPTLPGWLASMSVTDVVLTVVFVTALGVALRKMVWPTLSKLKDFADDVTGEPGRPGVAARPGLMERMSAVECMAQQAAKDAAEASKNTKPNGGSSSHDDIIRRFTETDRSIAEVREALRVQGKIVGPLIEALPIVARSIPAHTDTLEEG